MESISIVAVTDDLIAVNHGRVTKTPVKKGTIKQEALESAEISGFERDTFENVLDEMDF